MAAKAVPEIKLGGYQSLFQSPVQTGGKRMVLLPLTQLHQHSRLHVEVREDAYLQELTESIRSHGILEDVRVISDSAGGYIIVSGRHRCRAAELAGLQEVSTIIDDTMTMEQAEIAISDCNLRHELSVMEKAWTYRIKREAENRQGMRSDLHGVTEKDLSAESERTMQRYIRLTYLIPELQQLTEQKGAKRLPVRSGAALSYLPQELQQLFYELLGNEAGGKPPSLADIEFLKVKNDKGMLQEADIHTLFQPKSPTALKSKISLSPDKLRQWIPAYYSAEQTEELILSLLREWAER